jgi:hypothetical protein
VLDPNKKMNHFKKYWDENLQQEALENAEHVVSISKHCRDNNLTFVISFRSTICAFMVMLNMFLSRKVAQPESRSLGFCRNLVMMRWMTMTLIHQPHPLHPQPRHQLIHGNPGFTTSTTMSTHLTSWLKIKQLSSGGGYVFFLFIHTTKILNLHIQS